eukprot:TRINITY_DN260_c0_g1_i6.p1 TRINITY_DN260_c0_g1~~TRINITY_DN260_c0_g1_i6.p1  ORF type:complete len:379 (-),score=83.74 TRINITY_DN260_c0_g1_i6:107-1243(-)
MIQLQRSSMMAHRILGLVALVALAAQAQQATPDDPCQITIQSSHNKYDLTTLKFPANNPSRFYQGQNMFKVNFCGAAACFSMGQPTPGCKQLASAAFGQGEESIGSYPGFSSADLLQSDIQDVNFKTQGTSQTMFDMNSKGIKLFYYAPGHAPAPGTQTQPGMQQPGMQQPGMQQPGMQQPGMQQPQQGAGYPINSYAPPPPPNAGGWPNSGRRLLQWGTPPQQQLSNPLSQQHGRLTSSDSMTVFVICNPDMAGQAPRPVIFAPSQEYQTRTKSYLFVMESSAGCPIHENSIEPSAASSSPCTCSAAGRLGWGWTFIICLAVMLVLYCGCGIFYKIKKLGVTGIEAIPNIEFWSDYPSVVKEVCQPLASGVLSHHQL